MVSSFWSYKLYRSWSEIINFIGDDSLEVLTDLVHWTSNLRVPCGLGNIVIKLNSIITQQNPNSDVAYKGFT